MAPRYRQAISGYGQTGDDARADAIRNLPYDLDSGKYKAHEVRDPVKVGNEYKVDIAFTFARGVQFPKETKPTARSSTAGGSTFGTDIADLLQ